MLFRLNAAGYHLLQTKFGGSVKNFEQSHSTMVRPYWVEDSAVSTAAWFRKVYEAAVDVLEDCPKEKVARLRV